MYIYILCIYIVYYAEKMSLFLLNLTLQTIEITH